jgi:hypothetical protein
MICKILLKKLKGQASDVCPFFAQIDFVGKNNVFSSNSALYKCGIDMQLVVSAPLIRKTSISALGFNFS